MIINANNIVQEFSQANMDAIVQAYPLGDLKYRNYFPLEFNPSLTFGNLESKGGAKVMADIVAIGSKAPAKGRDFVEAIKGEIPKIEIARDMNEKDLLTLQQLRQSVALYPRNAGIKNQMISKVYEDQPFVIDGINARMEWMAKQMVSTGKFKTTVANNSGGVSNVEINFGVTVQNAAKNWLTDATADPAKELEAIQQTARGNGYQFVTMTLERNVLNAILNNVNTKAFVLGVPLNSSSVLPSISVEALNLQLGAKGLPLVNLWESYVSAETKAGTKGNINAWENGNIMLSIDTLLGTSQYTTSTEFSMSFGDTMAQSIKDDFILVKTFGSQDPIMVRTKGTAFAMPVLNNTKRNIILKTAI